MVRQAVIKDVGPHHVQIGLAHALVLLFLIQDGQFISRQRRWQRCGPRRCSGRTGHVSFPVNSSLGPAAPNTHRPPEGRAAVPLPPPSSTAASPARPAARPPGSPRARRCTSSTPVCRPASSALRRGGIGGIEDRVSDSTRALATANAPPAAAPPRRYCCPARPP